MIRKAKGQAATKRKKRIPRDTTGNYILESIFKDVHEYDVYFEFANHDRIDQLSPNCLQIQFKLNIKNLALHFPDNERMIELVIPITKKQNNARTKATLTKRYIDEFGDLIPKIRLSLQNQIAANNKVLGPSAIVKKALDETAQNRRAAAKKKVKEIAKKIRTKS